MFNSIELKIFPFYPNPPPVKDWMVPVALINLCRRIEPNWDLTIAKVCKHIDGVNHISKIAYLADCDIDLTRQAISHLLCVSPNLLETQADAALPGIIKSS